MNESLSTLAELFRYYTEPGLYENTGTSYRNGPYVSNILNANLGVQITPLLSSNTNYGNTVVQYDDSTIGATQNYVEHVGGESLGLTVLPSVSANLGASVNEITYSDSRGYISYTGFVGPTWQATADIVTSGSVGATYTVNNQIPGVQENSSGSFSPYASASFSWKTTAKTNVSFNYSHSVTPSDERGASSQESDRVVCSARYRFNSAFSTNLSFNITHSDVNPSFASIPEYQENDYYSTLSLSYHVNNHIDLILAIPTLECRRVR